MSYSTFQTVLATALACCTAGFVLLHVQGRRHEREQLRRDEQWRERLWSQATGATPPVLTAEDRTAFRAITAPLKRDMTTTGSTEGDAAA